MTEQIHWKHVWPCAQILAQFINNNKGLVRGKSVLELGAGCTGVVGLTAGKAGASSVLLTDCPDIHELFDLLQENIALNNLEAICKTAGFDWSAPEKFVDNLKELDLVLASDVFYDPSVFVPLCKTIGLLLKKFPSVPVYFAYQNRDDSWSIADLILFHGLECSLIRSVDTEQHTIQLGVIYRKQEMTEIFGGIEGGATQSKLVFLDAAGKTVGEFETQGTNMYLNGLEKTANDIANWVREAKTSKGFNAPLKSLGMGLSGAEDERLNARLVEYLQTHHSDIADNFNLVSDAVSTIAATFRHGGVVVIAGTGSSVRLLTSEGEMHGCGGWGHAVGDGGSGYWIANRGIRLLYDVDDGLVDPKGDVEPLRKLLHEHFEIEDKIQMLDLLYANFVKSHVATFTSKLAQNVSDPVVASLFYDGGFELGRQLAAVCRHMDKEMLQNIPVVAVGSVFKAWTSLKPGFVAGLALSKARVHKVSMHKLGESSSFGAALLAAENVGVEIPFKHNAEVFDTIDIAG